MRSFSQNIILIKNPKKVRVKISWKYLGLKNFKSLRDKETRGSDHLTQCSAICERYRSITELLGPADSTIIATLDSLRIFSDQDDLLRIRLLLRILFLSTRQLSPLWLIVLSPGFDKYHVYRLYFLVSRASENITKIIQIAKF